MYLESPPLTINRNPSEKADSSLQVGTGAVFTDQQRRREHVARRRLRFQQWLVRDQERTLTEHHRIKGQRPANGKQIRIHFARHTIGKQSRGKDLRPTERHRSTAPIENQILLQNLGDPPQPVGQEARRSAFERGVLDDHAAGGR
jgi:hypothetical protein